MYKNAAILAAAASGAVLFLAGCGDGTQRSGSTLPAAETMGQFQPMALIPERLFISNQKTQAVDAIQVYSNGKYVHLGNLTITQGLSGAEGLWVDNAGNLYAANSRAKTVTEYAPGGKSPICTYTKKLGSPVDEATDSAGNVYVVDFNNFKPPGYVDVYKQCSNTILARYTIITLRRGSPWTRKGTSSSRILR